MKTELELNLFKGFYGSNIDSYIDDNVSNDLSEIGAEYDNCDIEYNFEELAKDVFDFAKYELYSDLKFIKDMKFKELYSPKYYNYSNDKIYFDCDISKDGFINWLIELSTNGGDIWDMVAGEIIDTHTSCSGFISYHSNNPSNWIKDLIAFDLDNDKTVYKIGFIIAEYIRAKQAFENYDWDFESEYIYNGNYSGVYTCYSIKELETE